MDTVNINKPKFSFDDIAIGVGACAADLEYIYQQIQNKGQVHSEDIRQFAGRGIPIYAELAKVLNTPISYISKEACAGHITIFHVEQSFIQMTSENGPFFGLHKSHH